MQSANANFILWEVKRPSPCHFCLSSTQKDTKDAVRLAHESGNHILPHNPVSEVEEPEGEASLSIFVLSLSWTQKGPC